MHVDRALAQQLQRRVAGAEVVERDPHADRAQRRQPWQASGAAEARARSSRARAAPDRAPVDSSTSRDGRADVERRRGSRAPRGGRSPVAAAAAARLLRGPRGRSRPPGSRLGGAHERRRRRAARGAGGCQRASASAATTLPSPSETIGWKCATSSPASQRARRSPRGRSARALAGRVHLREPHAHLALAGLLGAVHRHVGAVDQLARADRAGAPPWRCRRASAPTAPRRRPTTGAASRSSMRPATCSPWGSSTSSSSTANSSPPSRAARSPGRTRRLDPVRDRHQHRVARRVAGAVVDRLEVVEVEEQHGRLPLAARQRLLDAAQEQRAVAEPGQRVASAPRRSSSRMRVRLLQPVSTRPGVVGQRLEQPQVLVGERVGGADAVAEHHHAGQPRLAAHRRDQRLLDAALLQVAAQLLGRSARARPARRRSARPTRRAARRQPAGSIGSMRLLAPVRTERRAQRPISAPGSSTISAAPTRKRRRACGAAGPAARTRCRRRATASASTP